MVKNPFSLSLTVKLTLKVSSAVQKAKINIDVYANVNILIL